MKRTVVPNRNMLLLTIAGALAIGEQCEAVAYGAHAGDHTIYPDCRPEFIATMRRALQQCDWHPLLLLTPFQDYTKSDIVRLGLTLGVPYELTWTCYEGGRLHAKPVEPALNGGKPLRRPASPILCFRKECANERHHELARC